MTAAPSTGAFEDRCPAGVSRPAPRGFQCPEAPGSPESPEGSDISGSSDDDGRGGAETALGERGEIDPYLRKAPGDRSGDGEA